MVNNYIVRLCFLKFVSNYSLLLFLIFCVFFFFIFLFKRNVIKDGFFFLEEIFSFVVKYNVYEIRVWWLLYDVEWNYMIYFVNVLFLFSEYNLYKNYVEIDW